MDEPLLVRSLKLARYAAALALVLAVYQVIALFFELPNYLPNGIVELLIGGASAATLWGLSPGK